MSELDHSQRQGGAVGIDSVRRYLHEVGAHPLLDRDAEVRLGQAVQDGIRARARLDEEPGLDRATRADLSRRARVGEEARREFVVANLRLVVSIAKHYQRHGVDLADLIQEGNLGLMQAVERFDWRLGFKFSTYATWWIRRAVNAAIAGTGSAIRRPAHTYEQAAALASATERLRAELGRPPSLEELATETGLEPGRVATVLMADRAPISLSTPVGDGEVEMEEFIPDPGAGPEGTALDEATAAEVHRLLGSLGQAEATVLSLRYGFDGGEPKTLSETAAIVGVSRERVRQIETRALNRLRHGQAKPAVA